jgi:hypothetical protein
MAIDHQEYNHQVPVSLPFLSAGLSAHPSGTTEKRRSQKSLPESAQVNVLVLLVPNQKFS